MITIKLPFETSDKSKEDINKMRRQQSSIIRWAYNRSKEGLSQKECRDKSKLLFNTDLLDSWYIQSAIVQSRAIYKSRGDSKVVFGGKKNFQSIKEGKISKEEWNEKRLIPLHIEGEAPKYGNRKFNLDIQNRSIEFKSKRNKLIQLKLPKIKQNWKSKLLDLQKLVNEKTIPFTVDLTDKFISISFELNEEKRLKSIIQKPWTKNETRKKATIEFEKIKSIKLNKFRLLGLDLNPNYIGLSIIQFNENDEFVVLHKEVISFKDLNNKEKYSADKKKHEIIETCKYISKLAKHWNCGKLAIEELNIRSNNKKKGKWFNRLCNNVWHRNLIKQQLSKRCEQLNISLVEVNAAYSSTVGNINWGSNICPDMVASSIEIARRAHKKFTKGWFYPKIKNIDNLQNRWKEDVNWSDLSWKEIHQKIKESKVKYRFQLEDSFNAVFRPFSIKSRISLLKFPIFI